MRTLLVILGLAFAGAMLFNIVSAAGSAVDAVKKHQLTHIGARA